jgi:hypothetical protein
VIAVSNHGASFRDLADYLVNGRTGQEQGRVAWSAGRNLPTDDPELAAVFMVATARQNVNVRRPVYHVAISFDPADPVDRATMERVADRVLERLGLSDYQVVIVAHQDRHHAHLHLMVNRVHPERLTAWERWKDQPVIQQVLREEEQALGLRVVPGRLASLPDRTPPEWATAEQDIAGPRPPSIPEPIADGRGTSRRATPRTVPTRETAPSEAIARVLQTYERVMAIAREHHYAALDASAARARVAEFDLVADAARAADGAFRRSLAAVYRDPEAAHHAFVALAQVQGAVHAGERLRHHPEDFGALLVRPHRRTFGLLPTTSDDAARAAAHEAADHGLRALRAHDAVRTLAIELRARQLESALARALRGVYDDAVQARAAIATVARARGVPDAINLLRTDPAQFGALRTDVSPAVSRRRAQRAAALALDAIPPQARDDAVSRRPGIARVAPERRALEEDERRAAARVRRIRHLLDRAPDQATLATQVRSSMRTLLPRDLERVRRLVTAPQYALAERLRTAAREALLGHEEE